MNLFLACVALYVVAMIVGPIVLEAYSRAERRWKQRNGLEDE